MLYFEYSGVLRESTHRTTNRRCWCKFISWQSLFTFISYINGVRQQVHCNTFNCCLPYLWYRIFQLGGMESNREILLAWRICHVEEQVKEQVSAQDRALVIGMMARAKIIRNDRWSLLSFWMSANQQMWDKHIRMTRSSLRSYRRSFDWTTLFSMLRLLFGCIPLHLWCHWGSGERSFCWQFNVCALIHSSLICHLYRRKWRGAEVHVRLL